ncbi:glutamic oxaloacetic transaminase AAT1 [Lyophyllum atratum]|nr:glutamic oxaloacetic transaminase AAT1 [Lyophyllum atratum]
MLSTAFTRRAAVVVNANAMRSVSTWSAVPAGPPDPILGVTEAFKADKDPRKINLGVGAYRDGNGKPYVLGSVKKAEEILNTTKPDKEYLPITGLAEFNKRAALLAYGADSAPLKEGAASAFPRSVAVTQSISGTGALRIGGAFLARHYPHAKAIYLPVPSWGNHTPIFRDSGLEVRGYRYFDKKTVGLDFEGLKADLRAAPEQSIVLLHACAHNPTGVDPTQAQWAEISDIVKERKLFPFFDMAYQGFASGDTTRDAFAVRHFVSEGHQIALAQSFAKNMGLYGERVGAFSLVTADPAEKARVDSQLKIVIRPMYSNPPIHGALIANTILGDSALYAQWESEVKGMADRIISMREKLYGMLTHDLKTPGEWGHIKSQIGMFSFTGLNPAQTKVLAEKAHVYMTADGRISMAGLNAGNIEHFAESVDAAVKDKL